MTQYEYHNNNHIEEKDIQLNSKNKSGFSIVMFPFSAEFYNPEADSLTNYNIFLKLYPLFFKRIGEINILLA